MEPHAGAGVLILRFTSVDDGVRVTVVKPWHEPAVLFATVTVYVPAGRLLNTGDAWKLVPSIEYVYCVPIGAVTVIDPFGTTQSGCVTLAVTSGPSAGVVI